MRDNYSEFIDVERMLEYHFGLEWDSYDFKTEKEYDEYISMRYEGVRF